MPRICAYKPEMIAAARSICRNLRFSNVCHLRANIGMAQRLFANKPSHALSQGAGEAMLWYVQAHQRGAIRP